jgi:hypothetical protein
MGMLAKVTKRVPAGGWLSMLAAAEQAPAPCHPNPAAAVDTAPVVATSSICRRG